MLSLSNRQIEIIQILIKTDEYLTIDVLASLFSVSARTIRYDLDQIRFFLLDLNIEFESKQNRGSKINASIDEKLYLKSILYKSKTLSKSDRILLISFYLLIHQNSTYEKLADICLVSKQTILNDIIDVSKKLEECGIAFLKTKGQGISIKCDEYLVRATFTRLISMINIDKWFFGNIFNSFYLQENLEFIDEIVNTIEHSLNVNYLDSIKIKTILSFCIYRANSGYPLTFTSDNKEILNIKNQTEFCNMINSITNINLNMDEKTYFCWLLMNEKTIKYENYTYIEDKEATRIAMFLIDKLDKLQPLNEEIRNTIIKGLSMHLKVALYRIRNKINIQNELLHQIKISIPLIYEFTKNHLISMEEINNIEFDENEIAYIAMYIASAYENSLKLDTQINVLLVCSFGVATSSILKTRISHIIPECNIIGPLSKNEATNYVDTSPVDLIISTNDTEFKDFPVITVNPLLNSDDIDYIKTKLFQLSYSVMCKHFLHSYADVNKSQTSQTFIHELVNLENIQILDSCIDWETAIHIAAQPLLEKNIIENRYIIKMIDAVKTLGTYMVLVPETAFIHAGTEDGINENCISILILKKPISFGDKNAKIIRNIVILGIKDKKQSKLLDIVYIFENQSNLEILKSQNITKETISNLHN